MSYDIKLSKICDNKVVWDDHVVENDLKTVILGVPISNSNVTVRINDFKRPVDYLAEIMLREDLTSQVTGTNRTFFVSQGPIYNGLKLNQLATHFEDVAVKIKVVDEDVTGQFTGVEDFFYTQARPLLRANLFDFNSFITFDDIIIKVDDVIINSDQIVSVDAKTGKIQLNFIPLITNIITITYSYKAKITELNAQQSRVIIKEFPKLGQEVTIAYYSKQNDGWYLKTSDKALIERSQDIVFYRSRNTNRFFVSKENVSSQFTGVEKVFYTQHYPLLPIFQVFKTTPDETLNNAALVFINNVRVPVAGISSEEGKITLYQIPKDSDIVEVSYYYQSVIEPDRISVDYFVESIYCDKCSKYSDLLDYSVDRLGKYEKVFDENKLSQDLKKIIRTILGSDPVATWYGTSFELIIGTKIFPDITKTKIINEFVTALSKLKSIQIQQEEYQTVTDSEFIDTVSKIDVQESVTVPSLYTADIGIITQSGRLVPITENIQTRG
jgi:phage baseplate assembly protein W